MSKGYYYFRCPLSHPLTIRACSNANWVGYRVHVAPQQDFSCFWVSILSPGFPRNKSNTLFSVLDPKLNITHFLMFGLNLLRFLIYHRGCSFWYWCMSLCFVTTSALLTSVSMWFVLFIENILSWIITLYKRKFPLAIIEFNFFYLPINWPTSSPKASMRAASVFYGLASSLLDSLVWRIVLENSNMHCIVPHEIKRENCTFYHLHIYMATP